MANIIPPAADLQGIKNATVLDTTASTLKESLHKLSGGLALQLAKSAESQGRGEASLLALGERMSPDLQTLNQATLNANDGIAMTQVAEAGLSDIHADIQELKKLVVASLNGALSPEDRAALQAEVRRIQLSIEQKVQTTRYNGTPLLAVAKTIMLQAGMQAENQISIQLKDFSNVFTPLDLTGGNGSAAASLSLQKDELLVESAQSYFVDKGSELADAVTSLDRWSLSLGSNGVGLQNKEAAQSAAARIAMQIRDHATMAFQVQANQSAARVQQLL